MTALLQKTTGIAIGYEIDTANYRQLQAAWDRKFVRPGLKDENEEDEDELEDWSDLQAGHSGRTSRNHYGLTGSILSAEAMKEFQKISTLWQNWAGIGPSHPPRSLFQVNNSSPAPTPPPEERIALLNKALIKLYSNPEPRWSCEEQRESINAILDGISPLVCILPTGGGKTALIMLPSILEPQQTSIIFTPYITLANDLLRHCTEVGLSYIRWQSTTRALRASIIIVIIDTGISADFILYLRDLQSEGRLARTYFDEAHTLMTERNFRPDMDLYARISLPVQKIHLTATFPPSMKDFYEERQLLFNPRPTYIRASSNRVNIQYTVKIMADKDFFPNLVRFINEKIPTLASDEKILIFCKTIEVIDTIVGLLNVFIYHSKESDKESNLRRWIEGERDIMVATGALGAGINIKGIKWVIHVEETWGCIPFIQESGRGGREGGTFNSYTILSNETKNRLEIRDRRSMTPDQLALQNFLITPHCRRLVLTEYLDGSEMIKDCMASNSVLCDNCQNNGTGTRSQKRQREQEEQEVQQRNKRQELSYLSSIRESIARKQQILEKIDELAIRFSTSCSIC